MTNYREILRLYSLGISKLQISKSVSVRLWSITLLPFNQHPPILNHNILRMCDPFIPGFVDDDVRMYKPRKL